MKLKKKQKPRTPPLDDEEGRGSGGLGWGGVGVGGVVYGVRPNETHPRTERANRLSRRLRGVGEKKQKNGGMGFL